jgi:hypothetical protein
MRLISLTAENFKRLVAVHICPDGALTPIVGRNGAGKTSVLDAIAAALGGADERPDLPVRRGESRAEVKLDLDGIRVIRRWSPKGSTLEVLAPDGAKYPSPQSVLDKLFGALTFDPLAFLRFKPAEQAKLLGQVAGVNLEDFATRHIDLFDLRAGVNRQKKAAEGQLAGMTPQLPSTPAEEVDVARIAAELQATTESNHRRDQAVRDLEGARREAQAARAATTDCGNAIAEARERAERIIRDAEEALERARETARQLVDAETSRQAAWDQKARDLTKTAEELAAKIPTTPAIDTAPIEARIDDAQAVNARVRAAQARRAKADEVDDFDAKSRELSQELDDLAAARNAAIAKAELPVPGLALADTGILLDGIPFAQASAAEQLRVSVGLGLALNPKLKLMLIRDGSLLDAGGMRLLQEIAEKADAQILIERVATGNDVGVIIVDGEVADPAEIPRLAETSKDKAAV